MIDTATTSKGSRPRRPRRVATVAAVLALVASAAFAADAFYLRLLREGSDAYNRKDYATAVRQLRIACFGFLDDPALLADGLVRLALAQSADGDTAGFRDTFQRLVEVEDRFQGYSKSDIPAEVRRAFEKQIVASVPESTLRGVPAFARLVPSREQRIAQLPPGQRRQELARLAESEPGNVTWPLMRAEMELEEGNPGAAREAADAALKINPNDTGALRLRGLAYAAEKSWPQAADDLAKSGAAPRDPRAAEVLLKALVATKQWTRAVAVAGTLSADVASDPAVAEQATRAKDGLKAQTAQLAPPTPTPVPRPPATSTPMPAPTASSTPTPTSTPTRTTAPTSTPVPPTPTRTAVPPTPTALANPSAGPTPPPADTVLPPLPSSAQRDLERAVALANESKLAESFALASSVADAHRQSRVAQFTAAEMAYRGSRFGDAVAYFRRGGDPGTGQPLLLFYLAVSLEETGNRDAAATALRRCLPLIQRTPYVETYVTKILGPGGGK